MLSMLQRLRRKTFRPVPRPKPRPPSRFARPWLEVLEDRLVLDAMLFIATGTGANPAAWGVAGNWRDLTPGGFQHVPNASDDVGIPTSAGVVALVPGENEEINSIVTQAGTALNIPGGPYAELKIDGNPPSSVPPGFPSSPGTNLFGGVVNDAGLINANTTNPNTGTNITFGSNTTIGPGDLNGNLVVGPNSTMTFGPGPGVYTFVAGATLGMGAGTINIAGTVTIDGTLEDKTNTTIDITGTLTGPGSLDDWANVNWTAGTISLTGGVTVYTTFNTSGSSPLTLSTTLTNEETTNLEGTGPLALGTTGVIDNAAGTLTLAQATSPAAAPPTSPIALLGLLDIPAGLSAPVTIRAPFTNDGNLSVGGGSELDLASAGTINLNGTIALDGDLYLLSTATSSAGFTLANHAGFFQVGDSSTPGTLTVPAGVSDHIEGNLEIYTSSKLTGGGTVYNSGRLQLDSGSSTSGLGAYVQSNSGTLAIVMTEVAGAWTFTPLTVTGTAQLSGTLVLPGYVPKVGDTFVVVKAGQVEDHFDSIPAGMTQSETAATASVTQEELPP